MHQRAEVTSDFLATVDRLWKDVHKYSDSTPGQKDSTTDFVMSGWAKIKAAKHEVTLTSNLKRPVTNSSVSDQETTRPESSSRNRVGTATQSSSKHAADDDGGGGAGGSGTAAAERQGLSFLAQGNSGIDRLSLDSVPNADIDKDLRKISDGLTKQIVDVVDFWTIQVNLNRAWKLLVLGLRQTESFARHMAMYALRGSIPVINETLLDSSTREVRVVFFERGGL